MVALRRRYQAPVPETKDRRPENRAQRVSSADSAGKPKRVWESIAVRPAAIQLKLTVGNANDPMEREADHMADQVMGTTSPALDHQALASGGSMPMAQRKCAQCEDEEEEDKLQRQETSAESSPRVAPPIVHDALSSAGSPLDSDTRGFMEARFGHDFSGVRVHSDAKAEQSAHAVGARAYTVGSDIVVGAGNQAPHTNAGRKLLAHELAHVVQQSTGLKRNVLQRWALRSCGLSQTVYVEDAFARAYDALTRAARRLNRNQQPSV